MFVLITTAIILIIIIIILILLYRKPPPKLPPPPKYKKYSDVSPGVKVTAPLKYFKDLFEEDDKIVCYMCQIILRGKPISGVVNLYHSSLVFYNEADVPDIMNPDETKILTTLELWAGKGNLAGSLIPILNPDNTVDTSKMPDIAIVFQDPVGYGYNREKFWKGYWSRWWYLGKTKQSNIIDLYGKSREWWQKNNRYSLPTMVSRYCQDASDYSSSFKIYYPPNNCDTFVQAMLLELQKMDSINFPSSLWEKLYWNDIQIIIDDDKTEKINMDKPVTGKELIELKTYISHISQLMNISTHQLSVAVDDPSHAIAARILNSIVRYGTPILLRLLLRKTIDSGLRKMFVFTFEKGNFQLLKVTLKAPYIQSVYGACPGMAIKN